MSIAREGWPHITVLLIGGGLPALRWPVAGGVVVALGLFTAFFLRDPERNIPSDPGLALR